MLISTRQIVAHALICLF